MATFSDAHYSTSEKSFIKLPTLRIYLLETISLSTIVLNSRDRQGMYGMQHFRMPRNTPYNRL